MDNEDLPLSATNIQITAEPRTINDDDVQHNMGNLTSINTSICVPVMSHTVSLMTSNQSYRFSSSAHDSNTFHTSRFTEPTFNQLSK